jgi:uncharacterized membrane protein
MWLVRIIENTDWKQRAYEFGAVSGFTYFANLSLADWASFAEKAITFGVSVFLAFMAWKRHKKKMRIMELEEQERLQRLYDLGVERKKKHG